ncbi:MAG: sugar ABC transporter substrate-binding protein [Lachnospiraceae bacterium]|nr:sugar ABC transporter substrate-binding protein [Lachnospiraceae bacterium]
MLKNNIVRIVLVIIVLIIASITISNLFKLNNYKNATESISDDDKEKYKNHFVMIYDSMDYKNWEHIYESANAYAMEHDAYIELLSESLPTDYTKEEMLELAIYADVDGIIIEGDSSERIKTLIYEAENKGIPVVTVFTDSMGSGRSSFVGISNYDVGYMLANEAIQNLKTSSTKNVMVLMDNSNEYSGQLMMYQAMLESFMGRNIKASEVTVENNSEFGMDESIRNILVNMEKEPDIMICLSEELTESVYQELVEHNKAGSIDVMGLSSAESSYKAVNKGRIKSLVSVDKEMMGINCAKALVEYVYTGYVSEYFMVDVTLVTKENVLEYLGNEEE